MDVSSACRAFVSVADRRSFTRGAAVLGVSQPVVSRRVAALERHLGGVLLDRTGRTPSLTVLGRRVLPAARRVLDATDDLAAEAEESRLSAMGVAVPTGCDARDVAAIELAGLDADLPVLVQEAGPRRRPEMVARGLVGAAVLPCAPDAASWRVRLGVAGAVPRTGRVHLDQLGPRRGSPSARGTRVWLLPEDDVPHVRDPLATAMEGAGMPAQRVRVAGSIPSALASVLGSDDLVVVSEAEARRLDLPWAALAAPSLERGFVMSALVATDTVRLTRVLGPALAHALGVTSDGGVDR